MTSLAFLTLMACTGKNGLPTTSLVVGGHKVKVELAATPADRATGLMFRKSLPAEQGMLFVYPDLANRHFWMANTIVPLSIAFIDDDGRVLSIKDMQPLDRRHVSSPAPVPYALEMNQGWFEEKAITEGAMVEGLPGRSER